MIDLDPREWLDFDSLDANAIGITLLAEFVIGFSMFGGNFGWDLIPLWSRITIMVLGAPLWYFCANKFLNG